MEINYQRIKNGKELGLHPSETLILLGKFYNEPGWIRLFPTEEIENLVSREVLTKDYRLTSKGISYAAYVLEMDGDEREANFEEFWNLFPASDELAPFHQPTRKMKVRKQDCKKEYFKILQEGVAHAAILHGLNTQIEHAKRQSSATENRLTFIKNSNNWLKDRDFEIWSETVLKNNPAQPLPNVK